MSLFRRMRPAVARFLWPLSATLILPLAACAVGPDFFPPAASVASNYLGTSNRPIKSSHQDYQDWWKAFHDPTLNELVRIGYNQNLTLLSAGTRVLQARAVLGIAIGSFYPQLQQGTGSLIYTQPSAATPAALRNAGPMRLPFRRLGSWTFGVSFVVASSPPTAPTSRPSRATTTCLSRFWATS